MAYIPIPTDLKNLTYTSSRRSFILFRCCSCGRECLYDYRISAQAGGVYHVFQRKKTKDNLNSRVKSQAVDNLNAADEAMFKAFNIDHDYKGFHSPVKCPHCGTVQTWSNVPASFWKSKWVFLWIILAASAFSAFCLLMSSALLLPALVVLCIPILPPMLHASRIKRAQKEISDYKGEPPVYYNQKNIEDLIRSPAVVLLNDLLNREKT